MMVLGLAFCGFAPGCDDDSNDDGSAEGGATEGATATDGATDTDGDTDTDGEPAHVDLFACGFELSCPQFIDHLGPEGDPTCPGAFLRAEQTGVTSYLSTPGPNIDEVETLSMFVGDGKVLIQLRERHCGGPGSDPDCVPDFETLPWEPPSAHQICDVFRTPADETECLDPEADSCVFLPVGYGGCAPVEDMTCDEIAAMLEAGSGA